MHDLSCSGIADDHGIEAPPAIARGERRLHVRAYHAWIGLLRGAHVPDIAALDPAGLGDIAAYGVLLDLRRGLRDAAVLRLGSALRAEAGLAGGIATLADVPPSSLLARLTGQCRQVVTNRTPIGFEAEFVNARGNATLYRGILLPFASEGAAVAYVYGVISWKEAADPAVAAAIVAEAKAAMMPDAFLPAAGRETSVAGWAGAIAPVADHDAAAPARTMRASPPFAAAMAGPAAAPSDPLLPVLRQAGGRAIAARRRALGALYDALATAYDHGCAGRVDGVAPPEPAIGWRALLRIVFGDDLPARRIADYAAVLAAARLRGVAAGGLRAFLEDQAGGIPGLLAARRRAGAARTEADR